MPVYQYVCPKCGKMYEESRKIDDRDNSPQCCEVNTERTTLTPPMGIVIGPAAG